MLVLSVKTNGFVQIGDNVRVYLVRVKSDNSVHLGFEAPREIDIVRGELLDEGEPNNETPKPPRLAEVRRSDVGTGG